MSNNETFKAIIEINQSQARRELKSLEELRDRQMAQQKALYQSRKKEDHVLAAQMQKDIDNTNRKIGEMKKYITGLDDSIDKLSNQSYKNLLNIQRQLEKRLKSGAVEKNSREWKDLANRIKECKAELNKYKEATALQIPVWKKFFNFLNTNWGAMTQILGAVTGLTVTMRKVVKDYADMEQEMANVRKYTGQTLEEVQRMNEDFKKMDTRTAREQLNQLAGAAGRLGITATESVEEFVDAADKIGVALGDDLGDGAVDQIGKLAMAFGEDEKMGLRGAMLATGSAINELAQNSSAKAGYLVDFTARVAGFGKQLGLTQAQIMGFGAVMDENLLREEMSATAFGNMLTKMQTDTEKFARIAGMSVKEFTRLIQEDANGAVLRLADSLRAQDPQTMMKMLDDMGLDGSRAVGVLSTLADKIDDVRERQKLATEAYEDGTSVIKEFEIQNNTVQAGLDKAKKRFKDLSIELGEKLMPIVKYAITSTGLLVKGMSLIADFVTENGKELLVLAASVSAYAVAANLAAIKTKLLETWTRLSTLAMKAFNLVTKLNPIGLLVAALTAATLLLIKYRNKIEGASEATSMLKDACAKLMKGLAGVAEWFIGLIKYAATLYDRFSWLRKIVQLLVLSFSTGFATIANGVKTLIDMLDGVGTVLEGIFTLDWGKIKDGYVKGFKAVGDAVTTQANIFKRAVKGIFSSAPEAGGGSAAIAAGAQVGASVGDAITADGGTLPEVVVGGHKKKTGDYGGGLTEKEMNKLEKERRERLRKAVEEAKASYQEQIAAEMLAYRQGITTYTDYMEEKHNLTQNYYDRLKKIYGEDSADYRKTLDDRERDEQEYYAWQQKMSEDELLRNRLDREREIRRQFYDETNRDAYQNEDVLNENLFKSEIEYMKQRQNLYKNGSKEWIDIEMQIQEEEKKHQFELEQDWNKRLLDYRKQAGMMNYQQLMEIEMKGVETLYGALLASGQMTQEEYDRIIEHIKRKYADLQAQQAADNDIQKRASSSLETAKKNAGYQEVGAGGDIATGINAIFAAVDQQKMVNEQLKELYGEDYENNAEYQEAKRQLDAETMQNIVAGAQAAYSTISQLMSAASSYAQACSDLEVAKINANYDKQIEAAGNNSKKRERLEKKRDEEIRKAKTKANRKAMAIELAQAVSSTAMAAINAYSSAAAVPVTGYIMAPIAAGAALLAGALQIATIKKQHQAEEAGYYEGGFTGGHRYRKEAGVVHEGEFVANHQAVNNPNLTPVFSLLDNAQRNNRVASLSMDDVRGALGGSPAVVTPIVNVTTTGNEELREALDRSSESSEMLAEILIDGIEAKMVTEQAYKELKKFQRLKDNAS